MRMLTAYQELHQYCAGLLILLAGDDPDPGEVDHHLSILANLQAAIAAEPAPGNEEERREVLQAAKDCMRLVAAVGTAAAECRDRLRAAHQVDERAHHALNAYRGNPSQDEARYIDLQR
jgi:hypothetical protein